MKIQMLLLALLLMMGACREDDKFINPNFRWCPIDRDADSAMVALERGFIKGLPADSISKTIDLLEKSADGSANRTQILSRVCFWKARLANREGQPPKDHLMLALSLCDSVRYPYDNIRIRYLNSVLNEQHNPALYYSNLKRYNAYFSKTGDDFMKAATLLDLGHILSEAGDKSSALAHYLQTDSIYRRLGITPYHLKTGLNSATVLYEIGDSVRSRMIIQRLLADREARRDTIFYLNLYLTAFIVDGDSSRLPEGYEELRRRNGEQIIKTKYELQLARMYLRTGDLSRASEMADSLLHRLPEVTFPDFREEICRLAADRFLMEGEKDSVIKYQRMTYEALAERARYESGQHIASVESRIRIGEVEWLAAERRRQDRLLFWIAILALAIVAMAIILLLMKRAHRHRISLMETQLTLEQKQRRVVSTSLAMTEKDNVLESILRQMESMESHGGSDNEILRHLQTDIRLHLNGKQDWEDFQKVFEEVHPSFAGELKQRWPTLSEGDVRLATYIRLGLTSKQIARMLLLQPDSVKKNRQRLRRRMQLPPDTSLEDLLRQL